MPSKVLPSLELLRSITLDDAWELPLHAQLKISLRRLILENFEDMSRFFSEAQLVGHLQISPGTVRRTLADLAADGLLEKLPARGTIVRHRAKAEALRNLAIFLPEYFSCNITEILTRLNLESLKRQIHLEPFFTHKGESLVQAYKQLQFGPQQGAAVLLANSPMATAELTDALQEKGYDCITVDTRLSDPHQKFVGVNNTLGIEMGMDHLTSLGHRTVALLVNEPETLINIQERIAAFHAYSQNRGLRLKTTVLHTGTNIWESSSAAAFTVMDALWKSKPRPTAIFGVSDSGAISAIQWLRKRKIRIPGEISVLGFDGWNFGAMIHPALTSVASPFPAIADAVFALLDKRHTKGNRILVTPSLLIRESTGLVPNDEMLDEISSRCLTENASPPATTGAVPLAHKRND